LIEGRPASERAGFDSNASAMRALNRSVDAIVIALFAATLALVNVQILCRFVLAVSVPWTEEVSRLLFIWLAYLGAAIGLREGTMIVIDTVPELLGRRGRRVLDPPVRLLSFAVVAFLFAASIPLVRSVWPTTLATVDWISNGWAYLAFTVSFALMLLYSVAPLIPGLVPARAIEARP
jgi:TRAP-type C4-dicarboxylate transport system permease small subunit